MTTRRVPIWAMTLALAVWAVPAPPAPAQSPFIGSNFRGYNGPNLYEPGFYSAYGYRQPGAALGPYTPFYGGSPSGSPGYYGGYPYDYRSYRGEFGFGYPAFYGGYSYGYLGPSPSLTPWLSTGYPTLGASPEGSPASTGIVNRQVGPPEILRAPGAGPARDRPTADLPKIIRGPGR